MAVDGETFSIGKGEYHCYKYPSVGISVPENTSEVANVNMFIDKAMEQITKCDGEKESGCPNDCSFRNLTTSGSRVLFKNIGL